MLSYRSKYEPLEGYLRQSGRHELPMSFAEIEQVIGVKLPPSARKHRPWWSNNYTNSVITHAWLNAGYKTARVDMDAEQLVFVKNRDISMPHAVIKNVPNSPPSARHPVFGCMKQSLTIAEGADLTQPVMPEWAGMIENPKLHNE